MYILAWQDLCDQSSEGRKIGNFWLQCLSDSGTYKWTEVNKLRQGIKYINCCSFWYIFFLNQDFLFLKKYMIIQDKKLSDTTILPLKVAF